MIFEGLEISVTGMQAQRVRMDLSASNLANINSKENGEPYRRKVPLFEAILNNETKTAKVKVKDILTDNSPFKIKYDPTNPDADQNGYVRMSNVDPIREMVDMMSAMRTYEANLTAFNTHKSMILKTIEMIKV